MGEINLKNIIIDNFESDIVYTISNTRKRRKNIDYIIDIKTERDEQIDFFFKYSIILFLFFTIITFFSMFYSFCH